ncbi:MAG TPA: hypothetical protein VEK76_07505 [Candidatus Binatia bacterium]|nr:hypothetical protein [Candidatus Binatia bacterium]
MLVSDFVQIDRPFSDVRDEFMAAGTAWLARSAVAAYKEGEQLSLRVTSAIGPIRLSKKVWVELGEPDVRQDRMTHPLSWRAAGATGLFPSMEAELEITPMGRAVTSISFQGSYVPPLGPLGRSADRMLLHRLAEASVRSLLQRVADHVGGEEHQLRLPIGGAQPAGES